jgi:hypothetical protein
LEAVVGRSCIVVASVMLVLSALACSLTAPAVGAPRARVASPSRLRTMDLVRRIDVNDLNMFVTNFGSWAYDLSTGNAGLIYPKGTGKTAVFDAGLWFGAMVNGQVRTVVAEYSQEYGPGVILPGGTWDAAAKPEYRVYKVARWTGNPQDSAHVDRTPEKVAAGDGLADPLKHDSWSEYMAGAVPHGAPWRNWRLPDPGSPGDSVDVPGPDVAGDQMLWSVYNDADPALHTNQAGNSAPLGLEIQQATYAFDRPVPLGNTVFLAFTIVNKGANTLQDAYVSLWSDPDLGYAGDDLVGCDTTRALGFAYNGSNNDLVYGTAPPAVGFVLLRGPATHPGGPILGLTSFNKYIGGTDPASSAATYNYMVGLQPDGSPLVNPVTGEPTRYVDSGDPPSGQGWVDTNMADKRMMMSAGPFTMAPGDTQRVVAAMVVGQGNDRLASLVTLECWTDFVVVDFASGFTLPDPAPASLECPHFVNCPRPASWWAQQCQSGGGLTPAQLALIAVQVDSLSNFFNWPAGGELSGFCATIAPPGPDDSRKAAESSFAAMLADIAAQQLSVEPVGGLPLDLSTGTSISCPGFEAPDIRALVKKVVLQPSLLDVSYLNNDETHRRALEGVNFGLGFFGGSADYAFNFFGSTLDPYAMADSFMTVEVRFSHTATQKAYRFLRLQQPDGSPPFVGRGYVYGGFRPCSFQVWDVTDNVQLDAAFVEKMNTAADGTFLPLTQQPASQDSTWAPTDEGVGDREYLFIYRRPYSDTPKAELAVDGSVSDGTVPVLYTVASRLRTADDVIDDGDALRFLWGLPPNDGVDARLHRLAGRSLDDPAVAAGYDSITACIEPMTRGYGIGETCELVTPVLVSLVSALAEPGRVAVTWFAGGRPGLATTLYRSTGAAWARLGTLRADDAGTLAYEDRDVTPGGRYGYRLGVVSAGRETFFGEAWVEVPLQLELALTGLRPNPATREATVCFTLPRPGPATLEVLDVSGRRTLVRDVGGFGPGNHTVPLEQGRRLPAGLYFLRLTQGGRTVTTRGVIVR